MVIAVKAHLIAYNALPKAACSTVKQALSKIDPAYPRLRKRLDADRAAAMHGVYRTRRFRRRSWALLDDSWWKFCVIRDPLERLISCYTNKVVQEKHLHRSRNILRGEVDLPPDPDPDFFFRHIAQYVAASSMIKHHALPAPLFLGPDLGDYDSVYPIEDLGRMIDDLNARSGGRLTLGRVNPSGGGLKAGDLQAATRDSLRRYLQAEYALVGAYYENPLD